MTDLSSLLKTVREAAAPLVSNRALVAAAASAVPITPRRRAAVLAHDGFMTLEAYQRARPALFYGSTAVAVGASFMAWYRRRQGVEAVGGWGFLAGLAGVVAYATRPGGAGAAGAASGQETATARAFRWLDQRAAYLDRVEPGWEDRITARVVGAVNA